MSEAMSSSFASAASPSAASSSSSSSSAPSTSAPATAIASAASSAAALANESGSSSSTSGSTSNGNSGGGDDDSLFSMDGADDVFSSSDEEDTSSTSDRRSTRHRNGFGGTFRALYLLDQIIDLQDSENLSDVLFVVGKNEGLQKFHAHRLILAAASQILHSMCYPAKEKLAENQRKESDSTNKRPIVDENSPLLIMLPEEDPQVFEILLTAIYGDSVPSSALNAEVLPKLLAASRKYGVERLTAQCIQQLEQLLSFTSCLGLFTSAPLLLNDPSFGRSFISDNICDVVKSHAWLHLAPQQISEILSWNSLDSDELTLFQAAIRWALFQQAKKEKKIEEKHEREFIQVETEFGLPPTESKDESKNSTANTDSTTAGTAAIAASAAAAPPPAPSVFGVGVRGRGRGRGGILRGRGGFAAPATASTSDGSDSSAVIISAMIKGTKAATAYAKSVYAQYRQWHVHDVKPTSCAQLLPWLSALIPLIRFPLMSVEELATQVQPASVLPREDLLLLFRYVSLKDKDEPERDRIRRSDKFHYEWRQRDSAGFASKSVILPQTHRSILKKMFKDKTTKQQRNVRITECLWRGSRDGFLVSKFHELCDGKGPTITIIKSSTGWLFGGFHGESWNTAGEYHHHSDSWLFTFGPPTGAKLKPAKILPVGMSGPYNDANYGPTFGSGHDLYVNPSMKTNGNSCSVSSYTTIDDDYHTDYASVTNTTLAGAYNFAVDDIEVLSCKFYA